MSPSEDTVITSIPYELDAGYVGREASLRTLGKAFQTASQERALQCVSLVSDVGMGKSRLVQEFWKRAQQLVPGTRLFIGRPSSSAIPYSAFTQLMLHRLGLHRGASDMERAHALGAEVEHILGPSRKKDITNYLQRLLRLPLPENKRGLLPQQVDTRMFLSVRDFFAADCERSPLILCFEDMESATDETISLLRYMRAGLRPYPIVIVITGQELLFERFPAITHGDTPLLRIDLPELNEQERAALIRRLCRQLDDVPEALLEHAVRIGKSPRLLHDLMRYLLESDVLVPSGSLSWRVNESRFNATALPETYEQMVHARLRVIDPVDRSVLEKASILGETFWLDSLLALDRAVNLLADDPDGPPLELIVSERDKSRATLAASLDRLADNEWVSANVESSLRGQREYHFASTELCRIIRNTVNTGAARVYSRTAAQWLELRPEGRGPATQERIGDFLSTAGDKVAASSRYRRAADAARRSYYNSKAITLYNKALRCLGDSSISARIHIWHDLGSVHQLAGNYEEALDAFERMLRLSWLMAARTKAAVAFNKLGRIWRQKGDLKSALEHLAHGEQLFEQTGDRRGIAGSLDDIAQVLLLAGRHGDAKDRAKQALEMRRAEGDEKSIAASLSTAGQILVETGEWDEARASHREALDLRNKLKDKPGIIESTYWVAAIDFERGDMRSAQGDWQRALSTARDIGAPRLQTLILTRLGHAARLMGRAEEARSRLEEALELANELAERPLQANALLELALTLRETRQAERARETAQEGFLLADDCGRQVLIAKAHTTMAEVLSASLYDSEQTRVGSKTPRAEQLFDDSIDSLRGLNTPFELAQSLEAFGRYKLEHDDLEQGRELLTEAKIIYRDLRSYRTEKVDALLEAVR